MPILQHPSSNIHLPSSIYTIGHSDHTALAFVDLLRRHGIALVVDARSQPYSRWAPQFNRENLARDLQDAGIAYRFMGDALGGRPADPTLYGPDQERPNYQRVEQTPAYQAGIDQLLDLAGTEQVAVMCSEGDHRRCHRHLLITQTLLGRGVRVLHIQPDGAMVEGERIPQQLSLF
jgi:uncharacterized protein (DUF488 family)